MNKQVIGITGLIGSGKGTIGSLLVEEHGFVELSFASAVKDVLAAVFGWDRDLLEGKTKESRKWREEVDEWWSERLGYKFTRRAAMQQIGTELFRNNFNDNIWIYALENKIHQYDKVVITDVRFKNEYELVRQIGVVWNVVRGNQHLEPWYLLAEQYNKNLTTKNPSKEYGIHQSEWDIIGLPVDHSFDNNGTIDELKEQVRYQLKCLQ